MFVLLNLGARLEGVPSSSLNLRCLTPILLESILDSWQILLCFANKERYLAHLPEEIDELLERLHVVVRESVDHQRRSGGGKLSDPEQVISGATALNTLL